MVGSKFVNGEIDALNRCRGVVCLPGHEYKKDQGETYTELLSIPLSDLLTSIPQLVKKQEPPKPIRMSKGRQTIKRKRGNERQRQLNDSVVRPPVFRIATGAREHEVGNNRNPDCQNEEDRGREPGSPLVGLI